MSKQRLFFLTLLLTTGALLVTFYVHRPKPRPRLVPLKDGLFLTSQLQPESVRGLKRWRIKTVIDIRPDGEAADQAPSSAIESAAKGNGMDFHYIPVPHEGIPDSAVDALSRALSPEAMPAVLYCRTGRRAVRLFALVEASRADGPAASDIIEMVGVAGFSADDLKEEISQRLSHRGNASAVTQ